MYTHSSQIKEDLPKKSDRLAAYTAKIKTAIAPLLTENRAELRKYSGPGLETIPTEWPKNDDVDDLLVVPTGYWHDEEVSYIANLLDRLRSFPKPGKRVMAESEFDGYDAVSIMNLPAPF